ncbi:YbaN family protein [Jannaschia formosa]|uniref:YbaN family protein n=1 Tax=Jannaschia formosa TaxID=2259592 RepID=UPI001FD7B3B8|nr:YbaN family protein [Jannaschia formosa]
MTVRPLAAIRADGAREGLVRLGWFVLGASSLALGTVGIILPLLPTVPFVILAAFAFARGAPSLHARLMRSRTFGPIIADWRANGAIALRYKCLAGAVMAGTFGISVAMALPATLLVIQAACIAAAAAFILSRPSQRP